MMNEIIRIVSGVTLLSWEKIKAEVCPDGVARFKHEFNVGNGINCVVVHVITLFVVGTYVRTGAVRKYS